MVFPADTRMCPQCRVTQVRRRTSGSFGQVVKPEEKKAPEPAPVAVKLPHIIRDVRFNLPFKTGAVWTSGALVALEAGIILLSEKDKLKPEDVAAAPPPQGARVATNSFFVDKGIITRVVHDSLRGFFIEAEGRKLPLRLAAPQWREMDAVCDLLGIPKG
jgi:hypothetical protein